MRILLMLILFCPGLLMAANIQVTTDRALLQEGESFELIFEADDTPDDDPDFRPLEQSVEILQTHTNRSYTYVNGKMQHQIRWSLTVMPRQTGKVQIPSISFGRDRSPPLTLTVKAGNQASNELLENMLQLEVDTDYRQAYVQAPITLTIRLLQALRIDQANLSKPEVSIGDAAVEQIREDRQYQIQRNGRNILVTERTYSILPQSSGPLRIEPFEMQARVYTGRSGGRRIDDMFNRGSGTIVRRTTEAIDIEVLPIPAQFTGQHWLPASKADLQESWSGITDELKVGEPITRTLKLSVTGVGKGQLPELMKEAPPGWKIYPDQPQLDQSLPEQQLVSERVEKVALIPTRAGDLTLPAMTLHWWNLETDSQETLTLPARSFKVSPAPATVMSPPAQGVAAEITTEDNRSAPEPETVIKTILPDWVIPALLLSGLGWLLAAWLWWQQRAASDQIGKTAAVYRPDSSAARRGAEKSLQQACQQHDPAAARSALLDWASAANHGIRMSGLDQVGELFNGNLDRELGNLGEHLYSNRQEVWKGEELWQAFTAHKSVIEQNRPNSSGPELQALHKFA